MDEAALRNSDEYRTDVYALLAWQEAWLRPEKREALREDLTAILEHFPGHGLSLRALAQLAREDGRGGEAIALLERLAEREHPNPGVLLDLLELDPERAEEGEFRRRLQEAGKLPNAPARLLDHLAAEALRDGNSREALRLLEAAWAKNPASDILRARLGRVLWQTGDPVKAALVLSGLAPEARDATLTRMEAVGRLLAGDVRGAKTLLESLLALDPGDLFSAWWLAGLEERRGRSWRADLLFQQVAEGPHRTHGERAIGALALLVLNEADRAEQLLLRAQEDEEASLEIRFMLGIVHLLERRYVKASECFAAVYASDPLHLFREFRLCSTNLRRELIEEYMQRLRPENSELAGFLESALLPGDADGVDGCA